MSSESFVPDASLVVAWLVIDEQNDKVDRVFDNVPSTGLLVPAIWRLEVANSLNMMVLRKRLTIAGRTKYLDDLDQLPVEIDRETHVRAWPETLALADVHKLTTYDAAYLELALRVGRPLGTLDKDLRKAAKVEGVKVLPA